MLAEFILLFQLTFYLNLFNSGSLLLYSEYSQKMKQNNMQREQLYQQRHHQQSHGPPADQVDQYQNTVDRWSDLQRVRSRDGATPQQQQQLFRQDDQLSNGQGQGQRRGMARRRQQEDPSHLRSVAQQYSRQAQETLQDGTNPAHMTSKDQSDSRNDNYALGNKSHRQQPSRASQIQARQLEKQSEQIGQDNNSKYASRRVNADENHLKYQAYAPEKIRAAQLDNRLISEEELVALQEKPNEERARNQRRSKLTFGKQSSKHQKQGSNLAGPVGNSAENQRREIVSQYLNVPINQEDGETEDKYPRATIKKYKQSKDQPNNQSGKPSANVPLMKDPSDNSYFVSHVPSQKASKNKDDPSRNPPKANQELLQKRLQEQEYERSNRAGQSEISKDFEGAMIHGNAVISARTRSQSKLIGSKAQPKQQKEQMPQMFKTAGNAQNFAGQADAGVAEQQDMSLNFALNAKNLRSADQSKNGHALDGLRSADETEQQVHDTNGNESRANEGQSNGKITSGFFGFLDNIKKNYFNKGDEKQNDEEEGKNQYQTGLGVGSQHTNESPNAGFEAPTSISINGAKQYQLKLKRAGVGKSPRRDDDHQRYDPQIPQDRRAPRNYGDQHMLTMSQPTVENRESHVLLPNQAYNSGFDQLENLENDPLRLCDGNDNSPDLDNSVVTDGKSEIRRIQRKSQQETNGLHVLQQSKQARSQHTYLGSRSNQQQAMTTKNQSQRIMFSVQSRSNKKESLRKMSYVASSNVNNEDEKNMPAEYVDENGQRQRQGYKESDDARWQREIEYRRVKETADLQMLKNQKRRSDLNMGLSKQILQNGSEYQSPKKPDQIDQNQYSNNNSSKKQANGASKAGTRQVNLFGHVKVSEEEKSVERIMITPERSQRIGTSRSPPQNQEDFDQLYNLQDAESSDTNLQQNQNHKILHQDGLPIKKTVDSAGPGGQNMQDSQTPVLNSRISNYAAQGNANQPSYFNKPSSSLDQSAGLKHRGEIQYNQNMFNDDLIGQHMHLYNQSKQHMRNEQQKAFGHQHQLQQIDEAFQSDLNQRYEQNLNQFLHYQSKEFVENQRRSSNQLSGQDNADGAPVMRHTAHFSGTEDDQDISDLQQYNSAKPSEDKIVMKNRGLNKSGQEGSFLELYGKNHIKSEQVHDRNVRANEFTRDDRQRQRSPNNSNDNQWLFEGLQQSLNRQHRDNLANERSNKNVGGASDQHHRQDQTGRGNDEGFYEQIPSSKVANGQELKSAKYTMKSKSPRTNKVGNLHLLLRGKSQNRVDSRGKNRKASGQNLGLGDQGYFPKNKTRDKSNPPSNRYQQYNQDQNDRGNGGNREGLEIQDTIYDPAASGQRIRGHHLQQRRGLATSNNANQQNQNNKLDPMVQTMYTFFKNIFQQENRDSSTHRLNRQSAETKASSGQSAMLLKRKDKSFNGWSPQEALEIFGHELTEFEKIEVGNYSRVYTIGNVRRENQYSIADKNGFYNTRVGEHLGYRYLIKKIIDKGSFGQVVQCIDCSDPNEKIVAAKIGKNKKFDVDNANIEVKFLTQLNNVDKNECADNEGHDRIVEFKESFNFRQHVIIIFEHLHMNLYKYISLHKKRKPIFDKALLKRISYQIIQGLKYMKNKQIIHCDMKPENIIFTDSKCQNIKIIDFGASCKDWNSGFFYVQSRYYRAPEIVLGLPYDHAVDMWSLGCIVYELITGRPIFPAKDENELLEYFTITVGHLPESMITQGKNFKKFYKKSTSIFGSVSYDLIRSKKTIIGSKLKERSEPVRHLLQNFEVEEDIADFIEKCLVYDVECRLTPHDALFHQWFYVKKPQGQQSQNKEQSHDTQQKLQKQDQ